MKTKDLLIGLFALVLLGTLGAIWFMPDGLKDAPAVTLKTLDGRELQTAAHDGPMIVTFWATTCPGCIKEIPHLIDLYQEFQPHGLEVVGVAMHYDPPDRVVELVGQWELPYAISLDVTGEVARAFGDVKLTPTTFLINPNGRIVHQRIGEFDTDHVRALIASMIPGGAQQAALSGR
ncbi:TlpA family protein disulfide reductase [Ectothiorhodospiraceae bacterium 2226]|nr:TlpA family protein disulfide reductase [Ectothiorhodospiraceae bacterium 2226]